MEPSLIRDRSKTIMVVEVQGLKIPWTEPRDITLDELVERLKSSGGRIGHVSGFNVGMVDGSVQRLSVKIDAQTLRQLTLINGKKPVRVDSD
jgi:prepilin-type processing-associated H-X9-DG protein